MKTAIDFYARGKQKEADADEYERSNLYSRSRFICPECGEAVHLTGSKYSNFFAHYKKSDVSAECDRRIDGEPTDSVYERIGLPIYMRRTASGDFNLYMAFKALPNSVMNQAISDNISISIDGKSVYKINNERFSCDYTALIPIDYILLSGAKYKIKFNPENKAYVLSQHWSDYADGFSYEGALFRVSEQGGKKVRHGDSISTEDEYYWVRKQPQLPNNIPGIHMKKSGKLILKGSILNVFKGTFSSDISDAEFNFLTSYLRTNMKVHLLEKQPEFFPIWPPVIKTEEGYVVNNEVPEVFGHIVSGNELPKIYIYHGISKIPVGTEQKDYLVSVKIQSQSVLVNIDRKYVSSGTLLLKGNREISEFENEMYFMKESESIRIEGAVEDYNQKQIDFETNVPTRLILVRSGVIEEKKITDKYAAVDLENGDQIYALHYRYLFGTVKVLIKEENKAAMDDERLCKLFERYKYTKQIVLPYSVRIKLYQIKNESKASYEYISEALSSNRIAIGVMRGLEEMSNEGGR